MDAAAAAVEAAAAAVAAAREGEVVSIGAKVTVNGVEEEGTTTAVQAEDSALEILLGDAILCEWRRNSGKKLASALIQTTVGFTKLRFLY